MKPQVLILTAMLAGLSARAAPTNAPAASADPNFIATPADLKARIPAQLKITKPDFVVFVPEVTDTGVNDTGNEHFLVFDGPDGSLMAVWTQSSAESQPDQHQAFARSGDGGKTWSKPRIIAGPKKPGDGHMASWGYPLVSRKGRIYVLYSQHTGKVDNFPHHNGWLHGICSDDNGATWSEPQNVPVRRSTRDNPDASFPPSMLCWQKPLRLGKDGRYFAGFTRWTSFAVTKNPTKSWISADSRVEFMRFENVDENPEPKDLKISWFMPDDQALAVPFPGHPEVSACQEPTVVKLPDGRLFCVMRTSSGSPFWSVSSDIGETWTQPRRLLRKDGGEPLLHPLSPCPMYDVGGSAAGSGRYSLFLHNHDGHYGKYGPTDTSFHRRPICLAAGRFHAGADQPVWFDEPRLFMDHDGVSLGKPGTKGRLDLALYSSFTVRDGVPVLWYPDRKFFLLGRIIGDEWFDAARPGGGIAIAAPGRLTTDIVFAEAGGTNLTLDAFVPEGPGPFPTCILVHGGGFTKGDKTTFIKPLFDPLGKAGFAWFTINYRLAPQHRYPACVEDVESAIRWVKAHAAEYKVDPRRIALIGESAGGHLVSMAGVSAKDDTRVAAVVPFYAPHDLESRVRESQEVPAWLDGLFGRKQLDDETWKVLRDASPIRHVRGGLSPFLLIHGTKDDKVPFEQSERFRQAMQKAGNTCDLIAIEGGAHGMGGWTKIAPDYPQKMIDWLSKTLPAAP